VHKLSLFLSILILASLLAACAENAAAQANEVEPTSPPLRTPTVASEVVPKDPPKDCPLTVPQEPAFVPPSPYDALGWKEHFWFGSSPLWTSLPRNGIWSGLPFNPSAGYTQKVFWWRDGYVWTEEPEPNLIMTGERLDAKAPPLRASKATNAYAGDIGSAMLVGVDFPTAGCWKVTGKYNDAELSFVVWVAP
jgi:hypothetical protein